MQPPDRNYKTFATTTLIIWAAMLMACFIYGIVFTLITSENSAMMADPEAAEVAQSRAIIGIVFVAASMMSAVMGIILPSILSKQMQGSPLAKLQTALIIRCACFDAVSIMGLTAGVINALPILVCYGLITAGAVLVAMTLPWLLSSMERIKRELAQSK